MYCRSALIQQFTSRLYQSTTTSGAKLDKLYATSRDGDSDTTRLQSLTLRHGGMGTTTVIQNESDARRLEEGNLTNAITDGSTSLVELFTSIGFPSSLAPYNAAHSILYTKLLVNCAINPLTALHHVRNGDLKHDRFTETIVGITRECVTLLQARSIDVAPTQSPAAAATSVDALTSSADLPIWPANLRKFVQFESNQDHMLMRALWHVYTTIDRTRQNYSSMVNDVQQLTGMTGASSAARFHPRSHSHSAGHSLSPPRPTEIESITGHLLREAKRLGLSPKMFTFNQSMYDGIKQIESNAIKQFDSSQRASGSA